MNQYWTQQAVCWHLILFCGLAHSADVDCEHGWLAVGNSLPSLEQAALPQEGVFRAVRSSENAFPLWIVEKQEWLRNSITPDAHEVVIECASPLTAPAGKPHVWIPQVLADSVRVTDVSFIADRNVLRIALATSKVGLDLLITAIVSPCGMHGVVTFEGTSASYPLEIRALASDSRFAEISLCRTLRGNVYIQVQNVVEVPVVIENVTYPISGKPKTVQCNTWLDPGESVRIWCSEWVKLSDVSVEKRFPATVPTSWQSLCNTTSNNVYSDNWASRWRCIAFSRMSFWKSVLPSGAMSANGLRGFRFGEAAGYLVHDVEANNLIGTISEGQVVPVVASGAPDICRGTAVGMKSGSVRMCLRLNRLGVRILRWSDIAVVGGNAEFLAVLPRVDALFDLDTGHIDNTAIDVATIKCASAEAKPFADSEVARLRVDLACGRISQDDFRVSAGRIASFQAIDTPLCINCPRSVRPRWYQKKHRLFLRR